MDNKLNFLLKVFILSTALSLFIKYSGVFVTIPATAAIALIAVFLPPVFLTILLSWKALQHNRS